MEFKSLTIKDFLSYYGEQTIAFSDMTTIFIGQNNTGKSKLFDAINFALYGRVFPTDKGLNGEWVSDIREISDFVLNNYRRKQALEKNEEKIDVGVQLCVELDVSFLSVERKIIYRKIEGSYRYDTSLFSVSEMDKLDGHVIVTAVGSDAAQRLEQYFSRSIQDYFLFQGEAASKIMQLHKGGNFSKAVREIARLSVFEDAKEIADGYAKHVNNILVRKINKNKELQEKQKQLSTEINDLEESLRMYESKRDKANENIEEYTEKLEKLEELLSQMKEFEDWFSQKNEFEKNIKKIQIELKNASSEKTEIAEDAIFFKISKKLKTFSSFYSVLEKKGEVPPSIPAAEIQKALDACRCTICNTDLSIGTDARKFAESRMPKKGTDELGNYLRELNHTFGTMAEDVLNIPQKLEDILKRKRSLEDRKRFLMKEKEELSAKLSAIELDEGHSEEKKKEIEELKKSVNRYRDLLDRAKADFNRNDGVIEATNKKLQELRVRQGMTIGSAPELTEHDRLWLQYAPKVSEAMEKIYRLAHDTAYNKVQEKADEYYKAMTRLNSGLVGNIKIDTQNSEIYTIDENGNRIRNINQGNRISIQLAVIAGILTVAQEEFGQQYPFVTDAPVSALGGDNKLSTIETMINAFEQSIIIVKDDSSSTNKNNDEIRQLLTDNPYVGYVYELSMSKATSKDEQFTVITKVKG